MRSNDGWVVSEVFRTVTSMKSPNSMTPALLDLQLADVAEYLPNDILAKVIRAKSAALKLQSV